MAAKGWTTDEDLGMAGASTDAPPPLEDGNYLFEIKEADSDLSQNGNPSIRLTLEAVESVGGGSLDGVSRKVRSTHAVIPSTNFSIKRLAMAAGDESQAPARNNKDSLDAFCDFLTGKSVYASTKQRNGFANIQKYLSADEANGSAAESTRSVGRARGGRRARASA